MDPPKNGFGFGLDDVSVRYDFFLNSGRIGLGMMDILIWRTETPRSQICVYLAYIECWLEWHTNYIQDVW